MFDNYGGTYIMISEMEFLNKGFDLTDGLPSSSFTSSSSYSASYPPSRVFDNIWNESNAGWQTVNGATTNQWIIVDFGNKVSIDTVKYQSDSYTGANCGVRNYMVEGSNDSTKWDKITSGTLVQGTSVQSITIPPPKQSFLVIKSPTNNNTYSLSDNTLIHLPDNTTESIIEHGIEQGRYIQLDVPFDKHRYFNNTPVAITSGKVFTHEIGKLNTLSIRGITEEKSIMTTWHNTKMTSNNAPSPLVASASSEYSIGSVFSAYLAFNGQINTTAPLDCWATSKNINTGWLQLDFGKPTEVNLYSISTRGEKATAQFAFTSAPNTWKLEGSNDGVSFDVVHEISNETSWSANNSELIFSLPEKVSYRFYRLNVTRNNGNALYLAIGQLKFGTREVK
ncbi:discoidin domain-containing protein [Lysinibacillus cavernae]|uniref:discoidin domain-containing protein n=1 Tax=Lysinibacillus cavernae TaxID=2666135 RepID=UPI0018C2BF7A|nr:discoidin domain-containing protein [Lysinibacillus cavernae]